MNARFGLLLLLILAAPAARADEACTLVVSAESGQEVYRSGAQCDIAYSPASSFKLALALMGFDSGLLEGPNAPSIAYDPALNARYELWRRTTTPLTWLRDSVVWYSQVLTDKARPCALPRPMSTPSITAIAT